MFQRSVTVLPAPGAMRPCKSELDTAARSEVSVTECLDPDKDRAEDGLFDYSTA